MGQNISAGLLAVIGEDGKIKEKFPEAFLGVSSDGCCVYDIEKIRNDINRVYTDEETEEKIKEIEKLTNVILINLKDK